MRVLLRRWLALALGAALVATMAIAIASAAVPDVDGSDAVVVAGDPAGVEPAQTDDVAVPMMIQLRGAPAAKAFAHARAKGKSKRDAGDAAVSQRQTNERAQTALLHKLASGKLADGVLYRVATAYNGVAVVADAKQAKQFGELSGVVAVHRIQVMERNNATTQPLIGAPRVWESYGLLGNDVEIGVIDTGIDYVHTMFGGPGTSMALTDARSAANNVQLAGPSAVPPGFGVQSDGVQLYPSAKVAGGFDFAGDAYNADPASPTFSPVPRSDANPEDCPSTLGGGHGSHTSGTAAGYGVNADGTTYTGPWDTTTPFDSMRIGPGVAPQAKLYALRVFGCQGTTTLTTQAIDWAVDPNGDGDPSDHLDVINMSLGATSGAPDDPSAAASDTAAAAGVFVVASAGNSGDVYYVSGSPGSAVSALAVASSVDTTDVVDGFHVNEPAAFAGVKVATFSSGFAWAASAPLTADLTYLPTNATGCAAYAPGSLAGEIVLVDWAPAGTSTFPCQSTQRANNAQAAGAVGIVMASGQPFFDTSITGIAAIRAVFTTFTVGQELKSALAAGTTSITFDYASQGSGKFVLPGSDDEVSTFSSRGPRNRDNLLKPDISAPGQSIFSTDSGTGTRGKSLNGTSMAAPHMAGVMALLRQEHPAWTVEELKALAMNNADHDLWTGLNRTGTRYGPGRVGAGRVDVPKAQAEEVIAYNAETPGAVSVSFGAVEVAGTLRLDKSIRVVNKGASAQTFAVSYDPLTAIPGVDYSLPDGATVSVAAGGDATFRVRLTANAALMHNTHDATIATAQSGNPRQWLSEASGNVLLASDAGTTLRVPVYAAARPASSMATAQSALSFAGATGSANLSLAGTGVSTGAVGPNEHNSLVTPFELQGVSPQLAAPPAGTAPSALNGDLQYIAATANASQVFFGLTTWRDFNTLATDNQFSVFIDRDRNGTDDLQLFATRFTDSDVFVTALSALPSTSGSLQAFTNIFSAAVPTGALNNNIAVLPVNRSALGMPAGSTRFNYRVESFSRFNGVVDRFPSSGYLSFDFASRGFDFTGGSPQPPVYLDMPGGTVPVGYNQTQYLANNSLGALLLHHYNRRGTRAQVVPVVAQISVSAPASKTYGDAPFPVSATASTGQAVTLASRTPGVCSTSGTTVTIDAAGSCTVRTTTTATTNFPSTFADKTISIGKASLTYTAGATKQYSDAIPSYGISFTGFAYDDDASVVSGGPSCSSTATAASGPGAYAVSCTDGTLDATSYTFASGGGTLTVTQEDARVAYAGQQFVSTAGPTSSTANVNLVASVRDITAVTGDPASDADAGDIRNATVRFVNRDAGTTLCTVPAVQLVAADLKMGTAGCTWIANLGTSDSLQVTVGVVVGGYYLRDDPSENTVVTVAKPIPSSIAGGGNLVNVSSGGVYAGDAGAKTNFGLNVKNNKSGRSFQGSVNLLLLSGGHTYQVESSAIDSVVTRTETATTPGTASFSGKATLFDITNPAAPSTVESGLLDVRMADRGEPGSADSIAITLWSKSNQLLFSSTWDGSKTVEQILGGGNLQVR